MTDRIEQLARKIDPEAWDEMERMEADMPTAKWTYGDPTPKVFADYWRKNKGIIDHLRERQQKSMDAARIAIGVSLILNPQDDHK